MEKRTTKQIQDIARNQIYTQLEAAPIMAEVMAVAPNEYALLTEVEGMDEPITVNVKLIVKKWDGDDPYDPYWEAENYAAELAKRAEEKAKKDAEAAAKKVKGTEKKAERAAAVQKKIAGGA